jgi:hypothetical protein
LALTSPRLRNLTPTREIVYDQNQLVIVVAVEDLDIDAGVSHPAREQTELAGHVLLQSLNEHLSILENPDASFLERRAGGRSVHEKEVGYAAAVHHPSSSALDAHPGAAQSLSHLGESSRPVFQGDRQISHPVTPRGIPAGSHRTSRSSLTESLERLDSSNDNLLIAKGRDKLQVSA